MFKWIGWVIRLGATALLLSFLCIWTTGYIVNSYVETVIKQLGLPLETQPFALSGVWGKLWGADQVPQAAVNVDNIPKPKEEPSSSSSSSPSSGIDESNTNGLNRSTELDQSTEFDGEASSSPGDVSDIDSLPVMNSEAGARLDQLSDAQRQDLYAMVVSKLNQDQLKQLSDSLQDGLTAEELVQLQSMLKEALTDEEYAQMMELLQGEQNSDNVPSEE